MQIVGTSLSIRSVDEAIEECPEYLTAKRCMQVATVVFAVVGMATFVIAGSSEDPSVRKQYFILTGACLFISIIAGRLAPFCGQTDAEELTLLINRFEGEIGALHIETGLP